MRIQGTTTQTPSQKVGGTPTPQSIVAQANSLCAEIQKETFAAQLARQEGKPIDPSLKAKIRKYLSEYRALRDQIPDGSSHDIYSAVDDINTNVAYLGKVVDGDVQAIVDPTTWKTVETNLKAEIVYCRTVVMDSNPQSTRGIAAKEAIVQLQTCLNGMQLQDATVSKDSRLPYNASLYTSVYAPNPPTFADAVNWLEDAYRNVGQPSSTSSSISRVTASKNMI